MSVESSDDPVIRAGREAIESNRRFIDSQTWEYFKFAFLIVIIGIVGVYFSVPYFGFGAGVAAFLFTLFTVWAHKADHESLDRVENNLNILSGLDKE
jgi:hypothetical protein